jgi:DNA-binding transcriptional MerR regulator
MKIGELAEATGLTTKTVRYYEQEGILPQAERTESGYRTYGPDDVERLAFVRKAKQIGLSLDEIKETLGLRDADEATCVHVRGLIEDKLAKVDAVLRDLRGFRAQLIDLRDRSGEMVDCCPTGGNVCGIVERSAITLSVENLNWISSGQARKLKKAKI